MYVHGYGDWRTVSDVIPQVLLILGFFFLKPGISDWPLAYQLGETG